MQKSAEREREEKKESRRDDEQAKEICKRKRGKLQTLRQSSCLSFPLSPLSPISSHSSPLSLSARLTTYVMEINCLLYMSFSSAYSISLDEDELPVSCLRLGAYTKLAIYPVK